MTFDPLQPFVLLDDASRGGRCELLTGFRSSIDARDPADVRPALEQLRAARADGLHAAGFVGFEAGYAIEPRLLPRFRIPDGRLPLLWFGLFERLERLAQNELDALLPSSPAQVETVVPRTTQTAHESAVAAAQRLIAAGDIYQVNLTFPADVTFSGHPLALYRSLRSAQAAPHGAVIHTGASWILSFSPELFFELRDHQLTARPMKGTAARSGMPIRDRAAADELARDPKNRAENLMIVDLLRNDLARVAAPGTVAVDDLFRIETYPTVHQMTSTVSAKLADSLDAVDVVSNLFPCGSVTGAPKIRAMEVIEGLEPSPRGLYTGSIGRLSPNGTATFNVAIRTLVVTDPGRAILGLGSGIVADSEPSAEWAECLTKAAFLRRPTRRFDLIETLRFDPNDGPIRLSRHLARLAASAAHFGFEFDAHFASEQIAASVHGHAHPARLRLLLSPAGALTVQLSPLPPAPSAPVSVAITEHLVADDDARLFHKTTDRSFYDEPRLASGAFEVLFVNAHGQLTEGSFTNLFVPRDGQLLTPPLAAGLLPGVLRAELIERGDAVEAALTPLDLRGEFFIGNSLRGLIRAQLRA